MSASLSTDGIIVSMTEIIISALTSIQIYCMQQYDGTWAVFQCKRLQIIQEKSIHSNSIDSQQFDVSKRNNIFVYLLFNSHILKTFCSGLQSLNLRCVKSYIGVTFWMFSKDQRASLYHKKECERVVEFWGLPENGDTYISVNSLYKFDSIIQ